MQPFSNNSNNSFFFDCLVNEVSFFKKALHSAEIIEEENKRIEKFLSNFSLGLKEFPNDGEIRSLLKKYMNEKYIILKIYIIIL